MIPVALIQEVGAYAGLIALPAFVVLAILHLSQARDVRRLREWAGRAPERAAEEAARRAATAAAQPAARPAPAAAPPASPAPAAAAPPAAGSAPVPSAPPVASAPRTATAEPATSVRPSTPAAAVRSRPAAASRRPAWTRDEHFGLHGGGRSARGRLDALRERVPLVAVVGAVAAVAILAVVIVVLASGGSSSSKPAASSQPAAAPATAKPTVAILNATSVAGLGHRVGARVAQAGYRLGAVGDAGGRQGATTVVMYAPGDAQAAKGLAASIGVARTAPADAQAESRARGAAVIVLVGADMSGR